MYGNYASVLWTVYGIYFVVGLVVPALLALIPANIAKSKGRSFGLWWFYGWTLFLVALIHSLLLPTNDSLAEAQALSSGESRKCPQCAELIRRDARVCRFCGYDLTPILEAEARRAAAQGREEAASRAESERVEREWQAERAREAPARRAKLLKFAAVAIPVVLVVSVSAYFLNAQNEASAERLAAVQAAQARVTEEFRTDSSGVLLTYGGSGGAVVIPAMSGGIRITSIGAYAFQGKGYNAVTSVSIPEGVTSIGDEAFNGCTLLTSVTIPASVTEIGGWAFTQCTELTSLTVPRAVVGIGSHAFSGCTKLQVRVPKGALLGSGVFDGCRKVEYY
ncbi:MAG TPA: leucine-rich repeat protein [Coriobacteriia bacterium]